LAFGRFFIYTMIWWEDRVEEISWDNDNTKENLVIKKVSHADGNRETLMLMIARYPQKVPKKWIEAYDEKEIAEWHTDKLERKICLKAGLTI
jgi:hypothetical protein